MPLGKTPRLTAAVLCAALLLSGCSAITPGQTQPVDPPPEAAGTGPAGGPGDTGAGKAAAPQSQSQQQAKAVSDSEIQVTAYFKDDKGFVVPLSVKIPKNDAVALKTLECMVEDGGLKGRLPKGFTALLPKGTKVSVKLAADQKLAVVDFSEEFASYNPQDERKILEAVTWTLTGFPAIKQVQVKLAGAELKEMPVYNTPVDGPLSRDMGINIELSADVEPGQSTPVTLYFQNQTADRYTYFVPVTRMVKRTAETAKTAMAELIKGPAAQKGLATALPPNTEVLKLEQSADKDVVTVDFNGKFLDKDKKASSDALQAVVLSLAENSGASKVQVTVNGDAKFKASGSSDYMQPAAKPAHINPVKF